MGSDEEWAITLAGVVSGAIVAMWGLVVLVRDVVTLALQ